MKRIALLLLAGCGASNAPTFTRDVEPIIARECVGCHYDGGIAPFALNTFEQVRAHAAAIREETQARRMPPFLVDNSGACNTFADAKWLSDEELDLVDRWIASGALEGSPAAVRAERAAPVQPTLQIATTLEAAEDYTPSASLPDDYRCFLVDPGIAEDQFLTAYEVVPGDARIVHHVILYSIDDMGAASRAVTLDEDEPGLGYTCWGASGLPITSSRVIAAWAPGTGVTRYPENTGIRLHGGMRAIMQVHYNTKNGRVADRTRIHLELAPAVDKPAEILGVADLGLEASPGRERFLTEPIAITPGIGGFVHGVFPHMHKLGRELHARVVHTDGKDACLTEVPAWDFSWQRFYFLERPMYVLSSDQIELSCAYDTRERTEPVRWGEGTDEEMCLLGLYVTLN